MKIPRICFHKIKSFLIISWKGLSMWGWCCMCKCKYVWHCVVVVCWWRLVHWWMGDDFVFEKWNLWKSVKICCCIPPMSISLFKFCWRRAVMCAQGMPLWGAPCGVGIWLCVVIVWKKIWKRGEIWWNFTCQKRRREIFQVTENYTLFWKNWDGKAAVWTHGQKGPRKTFLS